MVYYVYQLLLFRFSFSLGVSHGSLVFSSLCPFRVLVRVPRRLLCRVRRASVFGLSLQGGLCAVLPFSPSRRSVRGALVAAAGRGRPCTPRRGSFGRPLVGLPARRRLCPILPVRRPCAWRAFGTCRGLGGRRGPAVTAPVGFSGSRLVSPAAAAVVAAVADNVAAAGFPVLVGCASGVDSVCVSSVLAVSGTATRLTIFCAFGPDGVGALGRASSLSGVAAAAASGASVTWWAGGPLSVPGRARLARRSLAFVRALASSGGRLLVFPSSPPARPFGSGAWPSCGSGSWATACAAARLGVRVVAVPDFAGPLPLLGVGAWTPASLAGVTAWRWHPSILQANFDL